MSKETTLANSDKKNRPYYHKNFKRQNQSENGEKVERKFNCENRKRRLNASSNAEETNTTVVEGAKRQDNNRDNPRRERNYRNRRNREHQNHESLADIKQDIVRLEKEIKLSIAELQAVEISFS